MTIKRIFLPAFLLPVALCLLLATAEQAQALDCISTESIKLRLEERLIDGEPAKPALIRASAILFDAGNGLSLYLVGEEDSFYQEPCSTLRFEHPEAP